MTLEPWFEPKPRGYGAGMQIHPNGWRLVGLYVAGMFFLSLLFLVGLPFLSGVMEPRPHGLGWTMRPVWLVVFLSIWLLFCAAPLTLWFMAVARARTRGGWRWRGAPPRQ